MFKFTSLKLALSVVFYLRLLGVAFVCSEPGFIDPSSSRLLMAVASAALRGAWLFPDLSVGTGVPTHCHRGGASLPGLTDGKAVTVWEVAQGLHRVCSGGPESKSSEPRHCQAGAADQQSQSQQEETRGPWSEAVCERPV